MPITPVIGVRISWLKVARNCVFAALALRQPSAPAAQGQRDHRCHQQHVTQPRPPAQPWRRLHRDQQRPCLAPLTIGTMTMHFERVAAGAEPDELALALVAGAHPATVETAHVEEVAVRRRVHVGRHARLHAQVAIAPAQVHRLLG